MKEKLDNNICWKRFIMFFIIATLTSNILQFNIIKIVSKFEQLPTWIIEFIYYIFKDSGVLIGALIITAFLKKEKKTEISLFGTSKSKSLIITSISIIILTILEVKYEFVEGYYSNIKGDYVNFSMIPVFIYCITLEYGWRGYLHEELKVLHPWKKYLIIGFVWYLYSKMTFLRDVSIDHTDPLILGMNILGSWGIGQVAESTKSIITSACFHMLLLMIGYTFIKNGIQKNEKILILSILIITWFLIIKKWENLNILLLTRNNPH